MLRIVVSKVRVVMCLVQLQALLVKHLRSFSFTGNLQTGLLFVGSVLGHRPAVLRLGKALESGPRSLSSFREYSRVSLAMSKLM